MNRESKLKNLLWKEVAQKSPSACLAFCILAFLIYFYYFQLTHYKLHVQFACVVVILANIVRILIAKEADKKSVISDQEITLLKVSIWLNSLAWSVIFGAGSVELTSDSYHFGILVTILAGVVAGSIVTLTYDRSLFFPFQVLLILPVVFTQLLHHYRGENPYGHYLALALTILFVYQFRQYKTYRGQLLQRLNALLDLENSFSELKKSQSILVDQTAKLIHASKIQALVEMAGGLAHEVNNSLMVILGSSQQVERELNKTDKMTPSMESKLKQSTEAIKKIKNVIEGLKYFSLEMGPQPKVLIPLNDIFQTTFSYTQELLKAHKIAVEIETIPDARIFCHQFQITQILFNLIKNADDAMSDLKEGERWIRFEFEKIENFVQIRISNAGKKILPEFHSKLFQPFFSTKDVNQGTGLSLSVSKGVALDHKGDLYFEDREFTTFVLKLPLS